MQKVRFDGKISVPRKPSLFTTEVLNHILQGRGRAGQGRAGQRAGGTTSPKQYQLVEAESTSFTHCQLQAKGQITFGSAQHCSRVIQAQKHPPGHSQAEFKQTGCIKSHVDMQPQALMSGLSECNSSLIPGVMGKTLSSHPPRHKENLFVLTSFSPLLK